MLPFRRLSVCHVRALCSNSRRYQHDFFCIRQPMFLLDRTSALSSPNFTPKCPTHLLIWAPQTFDDKLRPNGHRYHNGHNGEPIGNHHSFWTVPSLTLYDLPFSQTHWVPNAPLMIFRISNDHISAKGHPINIKFCSGVRFSGSVDRMALFQIQSNPRWQRRLLPNYFVPCSLSYGANIFLLDFSVCEVIFLW